MKLKKSNLNPQVWVVNWEAGFVDGLISQRIFDITLAKKVLLQQSPLPTNLNTGFYPHAGLSTGSVQTSGSQLGPFCLLENGQQNERHFWLSKLVEWRDATGKRPRMLLNILQHTGQCPHNSYEAQYVSSLLLRNSEVDLLS